jgi:hypothetical protein
LLMGRRQLIQHRCNPEQQDARRDQDVPRPVRGYVLAAQISCHCNGTAC